MIFQPNNCYSAVNAREINVGDVVLVANTMKALKYKVSHDSIGETITSIKDESFISRFEVNGESWNLCYLLERK